MNLLYLLTPHTHKSIVCIVSKATNERADMSVYTDNGYENRKAYLLDLADEYDVPVHDVFMMAQLLGPSEDFDGLVSTLEEYDALSGMDW